MTTHKQDPKENVSKDSEVTSTDNKMSRRGLLTKAAMGVPLALTLAHKPAFGAICSISGFQSVNPSGVGQTTGPGCGGYSPGGWKENGFKVGNQDGNRNQWLSAGFNPNPRPAFSDPALPNYDGAGTLFFASNAFSGARTSPGVIVGPNDTLHDVLIKYPGTLEFHAIANLLNAKYFSDYRLVASDVVGLYDAYNRGYVTFTTYSGTVVNLNAVASNGGLQNFLDQYHPNQY